MNLRYIKYGADLDFILNNNEFLDVFLDNTYFITDFLSRRIRFLKIPTDGTFNLISIMLSTKSDTCKIESNHVLSANVLFGTDRQKQYLSMVSEKERFDFYLSLLEEGYQSAAKLKTIPLDTLFALHENFRQCGYKNVRLFKTKNVLRYGIKIELYHNLSSYDYKLMIYVYNTNRQLIGDGCIYKTFPDSTLFGKTVRHLVIDDDKLIITDFLNHPMFVCNLEDLAQGIVKSECVDEHVRKYIPCEENRAEFERLRW